MSSAVSKVSGHLAEVGSVLLQALQTSFKLLRLQLLFFFSFPLVYLVYLPFLCVTEWA